MGSWFPRAGDFSAELEKRARLRLELRPQLTGGD